MPDRGMPTLRKPRTGRGGVLANFNVVILGDSFPVSSLRAGDFHVRHREFKEELRVGPAFQAKSREVTITALPDRFSVNVESPNELEIQVAGLDEVLEVFLDYVGRRSIKAMGHNAVVVLPQKVSLYREFFGGGPINDWLASTGDPRASAIVLEFKRHDEDKASVTLGENDNGDTLLTFNFHYDLEGKGPERWATAASGLLRSLRTADEMAASFTQVVGVRTEVE